ncbi:MAG: 23S rRNA (adenine(2503)-C(2))-methyltransferase RlmN [Spiroplasma sp.]|nr:23S rRNA (adenine(2503)-C(2))-methyltransferase RlmN [Mycoplasmatales bacterium]
MKNIYDLNKLQLMKIIENEKLPRFRTKQIWKWLYDKRVNTFVEMKNIDKKTCDFLEKNFYIPKYEVLETQTDNEDGTIKILLDLDGDTIEAVLMEQKYGFSVCVTTQIGCKIGCSFCASHLGGFNRNLTPGEIVAQVLHFQKLLDKEEKRVSHIVIMGIGEPLDNLNNVLDFIDIINDDEGLNIGARHITLSTSGIVPQIRAFAKYDKQVNLAISLHAPNNKIRSELMKINDIYPVEEVLDAMNYYIQKTNRRVSLEYIMLDKVNDSRETAEELCALIRGLNVHVNLIAFNPVDEFNYQKSSDDKIKQFEKVLLSKKIQVSVRKPKGKKIDGACGQLRYKNKND